MKNFDNIANLFNQASKAKENIEATNLANNLYDTIVEIKGDFRVEMNSSANRIRFIQYKEPNTQLAWQLSQQIESLSREYVELCSKISYKDDQARKIAYEIKRLKYKMQKALDTERYVGWYITPAGKEFTESELSIIAQTLYQPGKKTSLFSFLYRLWAPLVINGEYVQEDLDKIPAINLHCEERVEDYQSSKISKHSNMENLPDIQEQMEDDGYMDLMDSERESL